LEGGVAETDDAAVHRSLEKVKAKNGFFERLCSVQSLQMEE
jgi:hypothetical protein